MKLQLSATVALDIFHISNIYSFVPYIPFIFTFKHLADTFYPKRLTNKESTRSSQTNNWATTCKYFDQSQLVHLQQFLENGLRLSSLGWDMQVISPAWNSQGNRQTTVPWVWYEQQLVANATLWGEMWRALSSAH